MKTTEEKKELKEKILSLLSEDEEFAFEVYRLVIERYGKQLLTKTYLDEALAKQSEDLKREFYEALARQSEDLKREFYEALARESEDLKREFYEALARQSEEFDKKLQRQSEEFDKKLQKQSEDLKREFYEALARQSEDLKRFIDRKFGVIGERWGINAEYTIHNFAKELVNIWGGEVKKWKKKVELQIGKNIIRKEYEIDIVITDGKEILVEVKSSCDKDDVERFLEAVAMYEEEVGRNVSDKVIVAFFAREDAKNLAEEYGIKIINV